MSTKQAFPNQHVPLHFFYGHDDCCLCRSEERNRELQESIFKLHEQMDATELNYVRTINHLDAIAKKLNIEWIDGDFPIDEVLENLGKRYAKTNSSSSSAKN